MCCGGPQAEFTPWNAVLWVLSGNVGGWLDPRGFIPQGQSMPGCASNLWGGLMILNDPEKGTGEVAEFL